MVESLAQFSQLLSHQQWAMALGATLGGLACFCFMAWRTGFWKRKFHDLSVKHAALEERFVLEQEHGKQQLALLERASSDMRHEFKSLAQDIFEEKTATFSSQSGEKMEHLLLPLREQLRSFRGRLETIFLEETREQSSLKQEILHLRELNQQISEEAINLTRAITGNQKLQGAWGELILQKILEQSGLREGFEFHTQAGLRDQENKLFKPDVIVHLPDQKDLVIDAKVSLVGWSRFTKAETEAERSRAMDEHIQSLRTHIKSLSSKDYSALKGLRTVDFVLMFVPIDAAFMAAIQAREALMSEMFSHKVVVVTPTTLLATLRTIDHFWHIEKQNANALEIADRASALYDKLRRFLEDMERLGKQIDTCRDTYDKAINKLSQGRGNLISQAGKFPELGVKVKGDLPTSLVPEEQPETT